MGVTRDFVAATIADALLPTFRRSIEDIIYEALDRRQIPTRTDFKELRDLANTLRGQVNGAVQNCAVLQINKKRSKNVWKNLKRRIAHHPLLTPHRNWRP